MFALQQGADHMFLEYLVPGEDRSLAPGARRWNWVWRHKEWEALQLRAGRPMLEAGRRTGDRIIGA
ncbi:FAD binding domain-containing protein [Massilia oculi]|uniref:FAD binding domain-containing protein n=1 Tax=Massilia oculi TaxID=945844 RepID=UPI001E30D0CD|nr:hypothetical protein [Massilia oculi]